MLVFTNQIRSKIGVMFGSPETTTGGNALKFYASVRLDVRRIGSVKDKDEAIGNQTRVKVVKNKVAPPFRIVEFDIMYGEGISKTGELIDLGVRAGLVEKSGSWFSYASQRIGQGRENAKTYLKEHPEAAAELEKAIRSHAGVGATAPPASICWTRSPRSRSERQAAASVPQPASVQQGPAGAAQRPHGRGRRVSAPRRRHSGGRWLGSL